MSFKVIGLPAEKRFNLKNMKKLLATLSVVLLGLSNVNAQEKEEFGGFEKGDIYISGSMSYSSQKLKNEEFDFEDSDDMLTMAPAIGFFVDDNIAIEFSAVYGNSSVPDYYDGELRYTTIGAGVGGYYYFTPESKFSFFTGAGLAYATTFTEVNGIESDNKQRQFSFVVTPGVNYFVSENFSLRASLGALSYSVASYSESDYVSSSFNLNLNLSEVNLGVTYKF